MKKISDLLVHRVINNSKSLPSLSPDPLIDSDALEEATLLSVLYAPLETTVAILFDLRTSIFDLQNLNAGLFILHGVSDVRLACSGEFDRRVWLVSSSSITVNNSLVRLYIDDLVSHRSIIVEAKTVQFIAGFVNGIGEVAVDIGNDGIDAYLQTIPSWESQIDVKNVSQMP